MAHTAHMGGLRWLRRRSRRQVLADALVLAGPGRLRRAGVRRAGARHRGTARAHLLAGRRALGRRDGGRGPRLRPGADPARAGRLACGEPRPALAVRRAAGGSPRPSPAATTPRSSPRGWPGCWPTAPAPSGPRCGWWWAVSRSWRPPGPPAPPPSGDPEHDGVRRSLPVRDAGELLGELVVREREHRPLSSVEARLFAGLADQAGPVLRGARLHAELSRRAEQLSARARGAAYVAPAPGRGPGRRAPHPRTRHPRRCPAAPRRPRGEPAPRRDPLPPLARAGREAPRGAGDRGGRGDRRPGRAVAGHLPAPARRPRVWSPR